MIIRKQLPDQQPDFKAGVIFLVDKPYQWTSFDVVNYLRYPISRLLGIKRVKIGHAGTLDPLASGLLILCVGKFTKRIEEFRSLHKAYTGHFKFGATTPSFDKETEEDHFFSVDHLDLDVLKKASRKFIGEIDQLPPLFSAKKIKGKRAYEFARADQYVELKSKSIQIHHFEISDFENDHASFYIDCSTGTYIRAIARDLGSEVESGAYLSELRRVSIGDYTVEDALDPLTIKNWVQGFIDNQGEPTYVDN